MSKRKGETVSPPVSSPHTHPSPAAITSPTSTLPSARSRRWISLLIGIHFSALVIALSANLAPSFLHGELLPWLAPVHVSTGQDYILLPLELTHAAKIDLPMVVELRLANDDKWRSLALPQIGSKPSMADEKQIVDWSSSWSRWPNLSRLITWIALEQPSSVVLPEFSLQMLKYAAAHETDIDMEQVSEIRLVQPHVLTFDELLLINRGQVALLDDELTNEVIYAAKVVRAADGEVRLLPVQEPAFTSKPITPSAGGNSQ